MSNNDYECPKCWECPSENLYTYINWEYFIVDRDEGDDMYWVVKQRDWSRDHRFKLIPESEVYPKITNRHFTWNIDWAWEEAWNEEHKCSECWQVFSFANGSH